MVENLAKKVRGKLQFWNIWSSYATYYFGKVNLSIVIPALLVSYQNLSLYNVGLVSSGFFFAYAIGQFLHGQVSERFNPYIYIALGLIGSAIINAFLGFTAGFFWLLFIGETMDGFFQAMGWSSCVRANALMQKPEKLEKSSVLLGTSYQVGNSIAWLISAFAVGAWGWQAGFWIASGFLFIRGITLLLTRPELKPEPKPKVKQQIRATLSKPVILSGVSLCFLNMVRYGVITWIPLYLFTTNNWTVAQMGKVGLNVFLIPIFGVIGTLCFYRGKMSRDAKSILFLTGLAISLLIFPFVSGFWALLVLFIGGFFLYGPHVFLVSTFPSRMLEKKVVAASTGFIDGMGYVGTVLVGIIVPFLITLAGGSWHIVFFFWAFLAVVIAVLVLVVYLSEQKHIHE